MSAPNPGRQSPDPKTQSDEQTGAPGSGRAGDVSADIEGGGKGDSGEKSEDVRENTLGSNPKGPMEDAAHDKVSKEGRGV